MVDWVKVFFPTNAFTQLDRIISWYTSNHNPSELSRILGMKKRFGGTVIVALAVFLVIRFILVENRPKHKQTAYEFFRNYPTNKSNVGDIKSPQSQSKQEFLRKPHLISVEGLNDLYAMEKILEEGSKVMLVWAKMQSLLSRSDAFPETAQGIREASTAWKDLLLAIEKEQVSRLGSSSRHKIGVEDRNCPFFVNMLNRSLSKNNLVLEFPCGLVVDSSITIIGVPGGQYENFQIELTASQLPGEPKPSKVLYYNVSFPGNYPVIVQNTWTAEDGWGEEERCPGDHHSANNLKVDGLVRCNEKLHRTVIEDKLNKSHPGSENLTDSSNGSNHISSNFPYVEENPFTSTLWVGIEGFHMTVNGRHETSFSYRKKLEPWLVSGVKVVGRLNILSALANGLPVSEDLNLEVDIEHLKAPPIYRKRLIMLIGVFSTGNNFERRMALRRSWMQYEVVRSGDVVVRFFIGLHKNTQVNLQLWKEAQAYGDIQLMPFVDYYSLITLKTIAICIMGTKILPAKYIMKTDDDAFVRIEEILSRLGKKASNSLLYGLISFVSSPHRDRDSKWYISSEEWPHASFPPWAHGPGYILSRDIAKSIVQGHQQRTLKLFKLEDVAMGIWIEQFKKSGQDVHYISDDRFYNTGCESDYILAHYQNPRMMLCLWEKLQKEHQAHCCD
ncbi:hypothetical protein IFM89_005560 [Coptis chinensis]|uniref:Galectin domain-containing protein n=1 Tax=Coptis chinensis TaxID=261450 RepID=A0A835H6X4_9MAGN|nr:hypothetical protein IFM89_005560 [Coptis chinensis]